MKSSGINCHVLLAAVLAAVTSCHSWSITILDLRNPCRVIGVERGLRIYKTFLFPDQVQVQSSRYSKLKFPPSPRPIGVHLPRVEVFDYDFGPDLIPYDPSYIDFPPPPLIPDSDGYKSQFVCDYDYDPSLDVGKVYEDYCFYYIYTPGKRTKIKKNTIKPHPLAQLWGYNSPGSWLWRDEEEQYEDDQALVVMYEDY